MSLDRLREGYDDISKLNFLRFIECDLPFLPYRPSIVHLIGQIIKLKGCRVRSDKEISKMVRFEFM